MTKKEAFAYGVRNHLNKLENLKFYISAEQLINLGVDIQELCTFEETRAIFNMLIPVTTTVLVCLDEEEPCESAVHMTSQESLRLIAVKREEITQEVNGFVFQYLRHLSAKQN